jgi:hypothetical protein
MRNAEDDHYSQGNEPGRFARQMGRGQENECHDGAAQGQETCNTPRLLAARSLGLSKGRKGRTSRHTD